MFAARTPAQAYALLVGLALLLGGAVGFLYTAAFGAPGETSKVLGLLEVNGWHNLVHVVSGVLGLAVARSPSASRTYAGAFGLTYLVVAIWGLTLGTSGTILTFLPVNLADDLLHVFIALGGVLAYLASKERGTVAQRIA
jgi:hypothetical protein